MLKAKGVRNESCRPAATDAVNAQLLRGRAMFQSSKIFALKLAVSWALIAAALGVLACASSARLPVSAGTGPHPEIPPPAKALIPLVNVVTAKGWAQGGKPVAADGTAVSAFASGLAHPR